MSAEANLKELGIVLPKPAAPVANYVSFVREGNLLFIAGQGPHALDGSIPHKGRLGREVSIEQGYFSARLCGLNCLAQVRAALGSLDKVKRVISLRGFVACTEDFHDQPKVINGASDLMVELFGDSGRHARAALGTNALPMGIPTEVELIVSVKRSAARP